MSKWFYKEKRGYLMDFQMPDSADQMPIGQQMNLRNLDVEALVERLHQAGVRALYIHAKDNQGNCYYDTRFGHKHTGIGDRDLMREASAACRERGMTILYYVQLSRERRGNEEEAYAARSAEGKAVMRKQSLPLLPARDEFPAMCLNGPGRDYQINCIRELSENYDFDGFWLDNPNCWMNVNPCHCDTCQTKYREDTGHDLPSAKDPESAAWKRFVGYKRRLNSIVLREIIESIRSANPELTVTHNGSAAQWYQDIDFCDWDDYVTHEFHYNEGYGHLAFICRRNQSMKPDIPFEIEVWRFFNLLGDNHMVRGYEVRPIPQLYTEMATILANGGFIQYYDQIRPDGRLDQLSLDRLKAAYDQVETMEPFFREGQKRVPYASIVWSKKTDAFADRRHAHGHRKELEGFHYALLEKRILHNMLNERALESGDFQGAKVVVLPSVNCLSEREAGNLEDFVKDGGGLVASHRTGLADDRGNARDNFLLADLFGCDYVEPFSYVYGFRQFTEDGPLTKDVPLNWPMTIWNKMMLKVRPRDDAQTIGNLVNPMRGMMMGHPPQEVTPWPAATMQQYGKGRVVYLPYQAGAAYEEYGHPHQRQLMINAVHWAAGEAPPIEVEAPETVEAVLWDVGPEKQNLHLVNRTAGGPARTKASVITEIIPVVDLIVRLSNAVSNATLQPGNQPLELKKNADGTDIRIPRIEIYGIIELDYA